MEGEAIAHIDDDDDDEVFEIRMPIAKYLDQEEIISRQIDQRPAVQIGPLNSLAKKEFKLDP